MALRLHSNLSDDQFPHHSLLGSLVVHCVHIHFGSERNIDVIGRNVWMTVAKWFAKRPETHLTATVWFVCRLFFLLCLLFCFIYFSIGQTSVKSVLAFQCGAHLMYPTSFASFSLNAHWIIVFLLCWHFYYPFTRCSAFLGLNISSFILSFLCFFSSSFFIFHPFAHLSSDRTSYRDLFTSLCNLL